MNLPNFYFDRPFTSSLMGLSTTASLHRSKMFESNSRIFLLRQIANEIIIFKESCRVKKRQELTDKQMSALKSNKFNGEVSRRTQRKMIQLIQNWHDTIETYNYKRKASKGQKEIRLVLLTLTLPEAQKHSDKWIKRHLFGNFIKRLMRHDFDMKYFWKAETQENGNIHFHMLIDIFIDKNEVRQFWNECLQGSGYDSFNEKYKDKNGAPTTRIEGLKDKNNAVAYCAKYISKEEGKRAIEGRLWGCSESLRELEPVEYRLNRDELSAVYSSLYTSNTHVYFGEHFCVIRKSSNIHAVLNALETNDVKARSTFEGNIHKLYSRKLGLTSELEDTHWWNIIERELKDEEEQSRLAAYLSHQSIG